MSTDTTEQVSKLEGRRTDTLAPQTAVKPAKTKRSLRQIDSDSDSDDIPRRLEKRPSLPDETGAETKEDHLGAQALISLKKTEVRFSG